ncbi:MAG: oxygen-independent coproporphyrinogen III oxidase [Aestuariivirga sp.]
MTNVENIVLQQTQNLPRYTSYPPANHFKAGEGLLLVENLFAAARSVGALSIYIHIPYCDRLCWFCGCHTKHTLSYDPIEQYVKTLKKEIALFASKVGSRKRISKLHLGGGSPSLLKTAELTDIRRALEKFGTIDQSTEISVEIDPSDVIGETIANLQAFGLTRASIGVQDFDPVVQAAINRPQTFEQTRDVVIALRAAGVTSLNIDALYGLPLQTPERLQDTIAKVLSLAPDRIALFGYAHIPWMKPHQKLIHDEDLPSGQQRLIDSTQAALSIVAGGYQAIGIDHFAKPYDTLATASRNGKLKRNFQGYTDDDCDVMLGFGPSSISRFPAGYIQNEVATGRYTAAISNGKFAASKGLELHEDDIIRGWIIERLMCDFAFTKAALTAKFGNAADTYWNQAQAIATNDENGLCAIEGSTFALKPEARPLVRVIASKFDSWLNNSKFQYSKAV